MADFLYFPILDKVMTWKPSVLDKLPLTKVWFSETMLGDQKVKEHYDKVQSVSSFRFSWFGFENASRISLF